MNWKKIGPVLTLSVLGFMCASVLGAIFLGPRLLAYEILWGSRSRDPRLLIVPQPLRDFTLNRAEGMTFSKFGYALEVPWKDLDRVDDKKIVSLAVFKSGRTLLLVDPAQQNDRLKILRDATAENGRQLRTLFGPEATASNYQLLKAILSVTPQHISWSAPTDAIVRDSILLSLKGAQVVNSESGLYLVESPRFRGFQKGDPPKANGKAILQVFDEHDNEVFLMVSTSNPVAAPVTQADLNRILQTLRVTPPPASANTVHSATTFHSSSAQ